MVDASRLATSLPDPAKFSNNYGKNFENINFITSYSNIFRWMDATLL